MRKASEESYDQWLERMARFELDRAIRQYASGKNIEIVMEEMSNRIMKKTLDPIMKVLKENPIDKKN